jgi:hypothetical protein
MMAEYGLTEGRSQTELARAMRDLMANHRLTVGPVSRYQNRTDMNGLRIAD